MGRPKLGEEKLPPDDELPELLQMHGSYAALARLFGCTRASVWKRCKDLGLRSPDRRGGPRTCALCGTTTEDRLIHRFQLHISRETPGWPNGRHAGSLDLCEQCWTKARNVPLHRRPKGSTAQPRSSHLRAVA